MTNSNKKNPSVVVIGGGTGTYVTLSGLKQYDLNLTAIISVADSGGSTGRLRDEFGFQPVGDIRQALAALAHESDQAWIRDLLLYRFSKGSGLEGHNLGNLILTALQDMTESTADAIATAQDIFRLKGSIYPITSQSIDLVIEYQDGTVKIGEHILDDPSLGGKVIKSLKTSPAATILKEAKKAIENADAIILAPGDIYGSLLPNLIVKGTAEAISRANAPVIYIMNLMTRYTQTHQWSASNHVKVIEDQIDAKINAIIINNKPIPQAIKERYKAESEYPVENDLKKDSRVIQAPLIKEKVVKQRAGDKLPRSYLRHDSDKLAKVITNYLSKNT